MATLASCALAVLLAACGGDSGPPDLEPQPYRPPSQLTMVTDGAGGGFESPMDAVSSPDGARFYFSAYATSAPEGSESAAAIYAVDSAGGTPQALHVGDPLEQPTGLLMSCDGDTLYIADIGHSADEAADQGAPVYTLAMDSNQLTPLTADGIGEAASLALSKDCSTLYVTGYTEDRTPALFRLPAAGGTAAVVKSGAPLVSPSGVYVDQDQVAWVMDHQPEGATGGVLFAIADDGTTTAVIDGLRISEPAGVSLISAGGIAVIPNRDLNQDSHLITVEIATGAMTIVEAPNMVEPAGIRTAIGAPVMAVVDADGDAIYRAE
ncbi:hypothetical protein [Haliangium sp.]|uniref:hypothetical protein n=1 Tax=Haliangium sp. TaxID=2663208 RepID=UPI003D0F58D2